MSSNIPPLEQRLLESLDDLWDRLVDPADSLDDADGSRWLPLDGGRGTPGSSPITEPELAALRAECRQLALTNEFAINGHENRISFVVGTGHAYRATPKAGRNAPQDLVQQVQLVLDQFVRTNRWHARQQEIVRRRDRDGEVFLRLFPSPSGTLEVRFVEPDQVFTPPERTADRHASFGIQTAPHDVETVLGYWIDRQWVDAGQVQHRKANVDANVKRGLPLFLPVRKNLRRAEKLLRNMSVVAEIQSAIAIIRKHASGTRATVGQFVARHADGSRSSPATGRTTHYRRFAPGTILDAQGGTDYQFPVAGVDAARYVTVLQAELRAIASRLVMPEFMLTSDASNANYASTMVAEGPAVRMFQRLQHAMLEEDLDLMNRAVQTATDAGHLPHGTLDLVDIQGIPPSLAVRDRLRETQADQILVRSGAMSIQTMAARHGLDPDRELPLIRQTTPAT